VRGRDENERAEDEMSEQAGKSLTAGIASSLAHAGILQRRCECGNHTSGAPTCAACDEKKMGVQRKLFIGREDDPLEHEAERIADAVTSMREPAGATAQSGRQPPSIAPTGIPGQSFAQRAVEDAAESEEDDELLPDEPVLLAREGAPASSAVHSLAAEMSQSSGVPLSSATRSYMEPRFGHDFSHVRVHTDRAAHRMSTSIGAAAFTLRNNIYFRGGRYAPDSHVIQQQGGSTVRRSISSADPEIAQRAAEVHVKLEGRDRVKVYRESDSTLGGTRGFLASSGKEGHRTQEGNLEITHKRANPTARVGKWGLQYFATFHGGQGFHSHICYPKRRTLCRDLGIECSGNQGERVRHELRVTGAELSHGCVRLMEPDATAVYGGVARHTPVKIYRESSFRPSPFTTGGGSGTGSRRSGGRTHTVVAGDTLSEIAEQYSVSIEALRRANDIPADSEHIEIGETLTIPESE
jgi:hypothetical protein